MQTYIYINTCAGCNVVNSAQQGPRHGGGHRGTCPSALTPTPEIKGQI